MNQPSEQPTVETWHDIMQRASQGNLEPDQRIEKSEAQWQAQLSPAAYHVTRQHGTEPAFSSDMCTLVEPGLYACVCCATQLFDATEKFDSATGWPSFTQAIKPNVISYHLDTSHVMTRVETLCNVCDAHLGHVFPDGPAPSGLRYCMNAVALEKVSG